MTTSVFSFVPQSEMGDDDFQQVVKCELLDPSERLHPVKQYVRLNPTEIAAASYSTAGSKVLANHFSFIRSDLYSVSCHDSISNYTGSQNDRSQ